MKPRNIKLHIATDLSKIPNTLHFHIQLTNKGIVYKNKKAYDRKVINANCRREYAYYLQEVKIMKALKVIFIIAVLLAAGYAVREFEVISKVTDFVTNIIKTIK